jgi:hypothetical protein
VVGKNATHFTIFRNCHPERSRGTLCFAGGISDVADSSTGCLAAASKHKVFRLRKGLASQPFSRLKMTVLRKGANDSDVTDIVDPALRSCQNENGILRQGVAAVWWGDGA